MTPVVDPTAVTRRSLTIAVFAALAAAATAVIVWGAWLQQTIDIKLPTAPLYGRWMPRIGWGTPFALAFLGSFVAYADRIAAALSFRRLLLATAVGGAAWGLAVAAVDGAFGFVMGIEDPHGYLVVLDRIDSPASFIRHFTDAIGRWTVHVRGHPPGLVAGLWWLDRAGFGLGAHAALVIAIASTIVPATLLGARAVAGEGVARRAAPFLVLAPAVIWLVTTYDAVYAAVAAWGIAAFAVACTRPGRRSDAFAFASGLVLGLGLHLSYGIAPMGVIVAAVALGVRRLRPLVIAGAGVVAVTAAFGAAGFWWWEGLAATRREYWAGVASVRPYLYFLVANLVVFALVVGPGAVAGALRLSGRGWWLVGAASVCVLLADASGLSKGEVERIWLPFWPWVALAAAGLVSGRRWWLAAQGALTLVVAHLVWSPW